MAKAGAPKKKRAEPKLTDKEQSERFVRTARELEADETGENFERELGKIISTSQSPSSRRKSS